MALSPVSGGARLGHLSVVASEYTGGAFDRLVRKLRAAGYIQPDDVVSEEFKVLCPIHENTGKHAPSLNITKKEDGGVWVYCHGGCPNDRVFREIMADDAVLPPCRAERVTAGRGAGGLLISELELHLDRKDADEMYLRWCAQESAEGAGAIYEAAHYIYRDQDGREVAAKVKWSNKEFTWLYRAGRLWQRGLRGVDGTVPLYRLDDLMSSEGIVYAVEGEKDADRLWEDGLVATSTKLVGRSVTEILKPLAGRTVVVIPDNDEGGQAAARRFANAAARAGVAQVRLMPPLGGEEAAIGYDVSDWLNDGGTIGELEWMAASDELVEVINPDGVVDSADGAAVSGDDDTETVDPVNSDVSDYGIPGFKPSMLDEHEVTAALAPVVMRSLQHEFSRAIAREIKAQILGESDPDSWVYEDLSEDTGQPVPDILKMTNGGSLFYSGELNMVWGRRGAGKTWVADMAMMEVMRSGRKAVLLDYENGKAKIRYRLMALGATPELLQEHMRLIIAPSGGWPGEKKTGINLDEVGIVVIDSMTGALRAMDLSSISGDDVEYFMQKNVGPFMEAGAGVVILDHVTHDESQHDRPRDSTHKLNRVQGAGYLIQQEEPFAQGRKGWSSLISYKDNSGGLGIGDGEVAARVVVDSPIENPHRVSAWVEVPPATTTMERAVSEMEKMEEIIKTMDDLEIPASGKTEAIAKQCRDAGLRMGKQTLLAVQRIRRERAKDVAENRFVG